MGRPTPEELLKRRQQISTMNNANSGGALPPNNAGPATSALTSGQGGAVGAAPSGPVGSGNNATNVDTPVVNAADTTQSAGPDLIKDRGKPGDAVQNRDAKDNYATGQEAAEAASNTTANSNGQSGSQGAMLNEVAGGQGADVKKGFQEMQDEIYKNLTRNREDDKITKGEEKKLRTGWRKIFNKISEDEMGLFLMDFGMRTMMAGETMGDMGALGAGGAGAMGALQGRRRQGVEDEQALQQTSFDQAKDRYGEETKRLGNVGKGYDVIETTEGVFRLNLETGETTPVQHGDKTLTPQSTEKVYAARQAVTALVAAGYDENQANLIIHGKGVSEEEARRIVADTWTKNLDKGRPDFVESSKWRAMSDAEKVAYKKKWKEDFFNEIAVKKKGALPSVDPATAAQNALAKSQNP